MAMNSFYGGRAEFKGKRELIFVVEGSKALEPHWLLIIRHYIYKLIRNSYEPHWFLWLGLVVFTSHKCGCLVRRSCMTSHTSKFLKWLEEIRFYNVDDAATTEGLAEALLMFTDVDGHGKFASQYSPFYQKHCILIAATPPNSPPAAIPKLASRICEESYSPGILSDLKHFYNVGDVAKKFAQCFISLSVISPTGCSIFKNILNMAKPDLSEGDSYFVDVHNPENFLFLISKYYPEAQFVFNRNGTGYLFSVYQDFMAERRTKLSKRKSLGENGHSEEGLVTKAIRTLGSIRSSLVKVESHEVKPLISGTQVNEWFDPQSNLLLPYRLPSSLQRTGFQIVWEGYLYGDFQSLHVNIRFEAYKSVSASEMLANDWPFIMQIMCRVNRSTLEKCVRVCAFIKECVGKAEILCFRKLEQQKLLFKPVVPKEWLFVRLPSQILLMCLSKDDDWCGGLLLPTHVEPLLSQDMFRTK